MKPTHLLVVYLLIGLSTSILLAHGKDQITEDTITEDQRKVHQECRNPDYKQYVKCLMRPKRHHADHRGDISSENDTTLCWDCLKKCNHHFEIDHHSEIDRDCEKKCSHCSSKKIRYKHQFTAEIEKECDSGKCIPVNDGLRTTNITTNIGIKNVINTYGNGTEIPPCVPPCVPPWYYLLGFSQNSFHVPSIVPQISFVPQITYGLGYGAAGGCMYNQWFCFQQTGIQIPSKPDCSICGHPIFYYKCDITCSAIYNTTSKTP